MQTTNAYKESRIGSCGMNIPALDWKQAEPLTKALGYVVTAIFAADEEDGGFVVSIAELPGVHSQGEDYECALANIREAVRATLATYAKEQMPIPWRAELPTKVANEEWVRIVA